MSERITVQLWRSNTRGVKERLLGTFTAVRFAYLSDWSAWLYKIDGHGYLLLPIDQWVKMDNSWFIVCSITPKGDNHSNA